MIKGVTHNGQGEPIVKLTRAYKVSIGIPATGDSNFPQKSDHFHIRRRGAKGEWVDDQTFMKELQDLYMPEVPMDDGKGGTKIIRLPLREFDIILLSDDIEEVFPTEYAWWATSEKKCGGHGADDALRRITALPEKERLKYPNAEWVPWKPCGEGCPELDNGKCKPNGELRFIFKDRPVMGSVATLSTTSYESIKRIHSSLLQIQSVTGGKLRGIPFKIVVRPGKTRFVQEGKVKTSMAYFINVEFREQDYGRLVPALLERASTYEKSLTTGRKMITEAEDPDEGVIEVEQTAVIEEQPEKEKASDMVKEFYPDNRSTAPASTATATADPDMEAINGIFNSLSLNPAQREQLYASLKGDVAAIRAWITEFATQTSALKLTPVKIHEFYTQVVVQPANLAAAVASLAAVGTVPAEPARKGTRKKAAAPEAKTEPAPPAQPTPKPEEKPEPPKADLLEGSFTF